MTNKIFFLNFLLTLFISFEIVFYHLAMEVKISLFLSVILLLTLLYLKREPLYIPKKFSLYYLFFILINIYSGITNGLNFSVLMEVSKIVGIYIFIILAVNIFRKNKKAFTFIFIPQVLVTAAFALIGILEFTGRIPPQKTWPLTEPFHWPSLAASIFLLTAPLTLYYFLTWRGNWIFRKLLFICLFLLITGWTLSKSFIILLILSPISIFCFYVWYLKKTRNDFRLKSDLKNLAILILLVLIILPNLSSSFANNKIPKEIALNQNDFFFLDKNDVLRFAKESLQSHFLSGIGPANFGLIYKAHLTRPWTWSSFAGNDFLQTVIELGILGLLAKLVLFLYFIALFVKKISISIKKIDFFTFTIGLTSILFLVISINDIPLKIFPIELIFSLFISYLLIGEEKLQIKAKPAFLLTIILLFLSLFTFTDMMLLNLGQRYLAAHRIYETEKILNWLVDRPDLVLNPKALIWHSALSIEMNNREKSIEDLVRLKSINPSDLEVDYQTASIIYNGGETDKANSILENKISGNSILPPKYYIALAKIALEENNNSRAIFWLNKGIAIYPVYPTNPYIFLSIIDATNYIFPIQQLYLTAYELTNDKSYLNSLILFTY